MSRYVTLKRVAVASFALTYVQTSIYSKIRKVTKSATVPTIAALAKNAAMLMLLLHVDITCKLDCMVYTDSGSVMVNLAILVAVTVADGAVNTGCDY